MVTLNNFTEALTYVNRLGFANPKDSIMNRQFDLCKVVDALEKTAKLAPDHSAYPMQATFHAFVSNEGYRFPWLGKFDVRKIDHEKGETLIFPLDMGMVR